MTEAHGNKSPKPTIQWVRSIVQKNTSIFLIYGLIIFLSAISAIFVEDFRKPVNLFNILRQSVPLGLLAIGQTAVLLTGGMDISQEMVARIVGLVVATSFAASGGNPVLILPLVLAGIFIGVVLGTVNGVLITQTHGVSFIITFGMSFILRGLSLAIARTPIRGVPEIYTKLYYATVGNFPVNLILMALIWFLVWVFFTRTRVGRNIYAVGGSEHIARLATIRVNWTLIVTYIISSGFSALAGLFLLSRMGIGDPSAAAGMTFQAIVACAVGGISLYGGKGSIIGTLGGTLLITLLSNIFNLFQINVYYQQLLLGVIVLIAVAAYKTERSA